MLHTHASWSGGARTLAEIRAAARRSSRPAHTTHPSVAARLVLALAIIVGFVLLASEIAHADITLLDYPQSLVALNDTVTVTWEESEECQLVLGRTPGDYTQTTMTTGIGSLDFVPYLELVAPGVWYCALNGATSGEFSDEFRLIVESPIFATPTGPPNGSVVTETTTLLEWDPVDNVPYYYVAVSDQEIDIEEIEGELTISGANLIWQALTGATSIQYGSTDPSGYFNDTNGSSPPLMDGFTYNWLIFNCYGNDPLLTSVTGAGLAGFTTDVPTSLEAPELTWPPADVTLTADIVDFEWRAVDGAVSYHVSIYETRDLAGCDASYPVWDGPASMASVEVRLGSILVSGEYTWRVVALDELGRGVASERRGFDYATETGTAQIRTFRTDGERLARVFVDIEYVGGGVNVLPAITNESGVFDKELLPGRYAFHASKEDYVDTTAVHTIYANQNRHVGITMRRAPARIRGRVVDEGDDPVFGAVVTARGNGTTSETETDADGYFALQVTAGEWAVSAERFGYAPSSTQTIHLVAGEYGQLTAPLVLIGTPGSIRGDVLNTVGRPIVAATVRASHAELGTYVTSTNCTGHFELDLAPATWAISATKTGYQASTPREMDLNPGEHAVVDPPILLLPVESAIMGRVTDDGVDIEGATVTAVPTAGSVIDATTNCFGEFLLMPPPGTYMLSARRDGFTTSEPIQVSVESGQSFTGVMLDIAPLSSAIAGRVVSGGVGVSGATVTNGDAACETDGDGAFHLPVDDGLHRLTASAPEHFAGRPTLVATTTGQTIEGLELPITHGASAVLGIVHAGGTPVPRAKVTAASGGVEVAVMAGADGGFEMLLEAGHWTLTPEKPGFAPAASIEIVLSPGQTAGGIDLELATSRALIRGSVTDSRGAVNRADVIVDGGDDGRVEFRTRTDSSGNYRAYVAPGTVHRVTVIAEGHGSATFTVDPLDNGETSTRPVVLPVRNALVTGRVTSDGEAVGNAHIVADCGESAECLTDHNGAYALWLDGGSYDLTVTAAGYATTTSDGVVAVSGETTIEHFAVSPVFAQLTGAVTDTLSGAPVGDALVTTTSPGGAASTVTASDGSFAMDSIVPGLVETRVSRTGYRDAVITTELVELGATTLAPTLFPLDGTISGRVTLDDGSTPVASVSVRAKLGDDVASSGTTDSEGFFALTGLDQAATYDIHASKTGYHHVGENPVSAVESGTTGVSFRMMPSDGVIEGILTDLVSGDPLQGATIEADDGLGHFGSAMTADDGSFVIDGLMPAGIYDLSASLYGYLPNTVTSVVCGASLELALDRNFARIAGELTVIGDVSIEQIVIAATNTSYAGDSRIAVPDAAGLYEIIDLRPGSYVVTADELGCVTTPPQVTLALGEGELVTGLDFEIEPAVLDHVEVSGDAQVEAGADVTFSGSAVADGGQLVETGLEWWISPSEAGAPARGNGSFTFNDDYIGEFTVGARDTATGLVGRITGSVYATVGPSTSATFTDSTGMTIAFPSGSVSETKSIELSHDELPDAKRCTRDLLIVGTDYHLKPHGVEFREGSLPTLSLPLPSDDARMVRWDKSSLEWSVMDGERFGDSIESPISSLTEFAAATSSRDLGVTGVRVEPNPFSPETGPVTISYELSSKAARTPFATVRVYTMAGQRVREILSNEPQTKGSAEVMWDGMTDDDELARNGRYVVQISIEDTTGSAEALATVVLVK